MNFVIVEIFRFPLDIRRLRSPRLHLVEVGSRAVDQIGVVRNVADDLDASFLEFSAPFGFWRAYELDNV